MANPAPAVTEFVAHLQIVDLPSNPIFAAGLKAILHTHAVVEECEVVELISQIDVKTRKPAMKKDNILFVRKIGTAVACRIQVSTSVVVKNFSDFQQLGRFTLRTEGKTIAVGEKVSGLVSGYLTCGRRLPSCTKTEV